LREFADQPGNVDYPFALLHGIDPFSRDNTLACLSGCERIPEKNYIIFITGILTESVRSSRNDIGKLCLREKDKTRRVAKSRRQRLLDLFSQRTNICLPRSKDDIAALNERLDAIELPSSPFTRATGLPRVRAHWVRPEVVVQVAFIEWTVHDKLRHPRLIGVRFDKQPAEVVRESVATRG